MHVKKSHERTLPKLAVHPLSEFSAGTSESNQGNVSSSAAFAILTLLNIATVPDDLGYTWAYYPASLADLFRAMAGCAVLRRGLVEQDGFAFDLAHQLVAIGAFHVRVHALQREGGAPVVIEERGFPFGAVVALGTGCDFPICELLAMRIFVALLALFGCSLEVHVNHVGFKVRRLVAVDARGGAVGP